MAVLRKTTGGSAGIDVLVILGWLSRDVLSIRTGNVSFAFGGAGCSGALANCSMMSFTDAYRAHGL